jgi:hypothetical protein
MHRLIHIRVPSFVQWNKWVNKNYKVFTKQLAAFSSHIFPVRTEGAAHHSVHKALHLESPLNTKLINRINEGQKREARRPK